MAYGRMASIVGIICNTLLCGGKALIGLSAGSVAIVADAVNNLSDAIGNIVSLVGFKLASLPANDNHPYGFGRYEYIAGLVVSVLVCAVGLELIQTGYERILAPEVVEMSLELIAVLVLSTVVKFWMLGFMRTLGKRIGSETLEANAIDSRNDVITTLAVLGCTFFSQFTGIDLDGYASLVIGIIVLVSGARLVKETIDPLLGQAPAQETIDEINQKILSYPGVSGTHKLMVHEYGPGRNYAMAHAEMSPELSLQETHGIIDQIEQDFFAERGIKMSIHPEPVVTQGKEIDELAQWLQEKAASFGEGFSVSDVRTITSPSHLHILFTLTRPENCEQTDQWLIDSFTSVIKERFDKVGCTIVVKTA